MSFNTICFSQKEISCWLHRTINYLNIKGETLQGDQNYPEWSRHILDGPGCFGRVHGGLWGLRRVTWGTMRVREGLGEVKKVSRRWWRAKKGRWESEVVIEGFEVTEWLGRVWEGKGGSWRVKECSFNQNKKMHIKRCKKIYIMTFRWLQEDPEGSGKV